MPAVYRRPSIPAVTCPHPGRSLDLTTPPCHLASARKRLNPVPWHALRTDPRRQYQPECLPAWHLPNVLKLTNQRRRITALERRRWHHRLPYHPPPPAPFSLILDTIDHREREHLRRNVRGFDSAAWDRERYILPSQAISQIIPDIPTCDRLLAAASPLTFCGALDSTLPTVPPSNHLLGVAPTCSAAFFKTPGSFSAARYFCCQYFAVSLHTQSASVRGLMVTAPGTAGA